MNLCLNSVSSIVLRLLFLFSPSRRYSMIMKSETKDLSNMKNGYLNLELFKKFFHESWTVVRLRRKRWMKLCKILWCSNSIFLSCVSLRHFSVNWRIVFKDFSILVQSVICLGIVVTFVCKRPLVQNSLMLKIDFFPQRYKSVFLWTPWCFRDTHSCPVDDMF